MSAQKISRREFFKDATIAGAAVAAAGIMNAAPAAAAPAVPEKWDVETDVLIIGSGYAGICAAIEAADAGAKVLILEKHDHIGGNSVMSGGHGQFSGTHVQKRNGVEDYPDWQFADMMRWGEYRNKPELVRTFVDNGADTVLWMEKLGVIWHDSLRENVDSPTTKGRGHWAARPEDPKVQGWASDSYNPLQAAAKAKGIQVLLNHRVTGFVREKQSEGRVLGVQAVADGKTLFVKGKRAVIMATGPWKNDLAMRTGWDNRLTAEINSGGAPYVESTGEVIRAAIDIGAGVTDMYPVCELRIRFGTHWYQYFEPPKQLWDPHPRAWITYSDFGKYQDVVLVQNEGVRFVNEGVIESWSNSPFGSGPDAPIMKAFLELPFRPRNVWAILDSAGVKARKLNLDLIRNPDISKAPGFEPGYVYEAQTLAELAEKAGLPKENLEKTMAAYNAHPGVDEEFGKRPAWVVNKPPFYGFKMTTLCHDQMGGVRINTKMQVIDDRKKGPEPIALDQEPTIPGLYAAGECSGGVMGWERGHGKISVYMTFGRLAGKNAAAEKPWDVA